MFSLSYLAKIVRNRARSSGRLSIGALFASPEYFIFLSPFRRLNLHIQPLENCILSSPISNILAKDGVETEIFRQIRNAESEIRNIFEIRNSEIRNFAEMPKLFLITFRLK